MMHSFKSVLIASLFLTCLSLFGTGIASFDPETVLIGEKIWMKENLHPLMLSDKTGTIMLSDKTGIKGVSYDFKSDLEKIYGNLYTYDEAVKLCPPGWHLPTMEEWNDVFEYLGGIETAGGKMKTTDVWQFPNKGATNSSGFSAVPAGGADNRNRFDGMGWAAHFWAAGTENGKAYVPSLMYDTAEVYVLNLPLNMKASVRYVKDSDASEQTRIIIPFGKKVVIDGILEDSEWADSKKTAIRTNTMKEVEVFLKHDGENLLMVFKLNGNDVKSVLFPEILLKNNDSESTEWTDDDYWFHVSGSDCWARGGYNSWENCMTESEEWTAVPNYPTDRPGTVECIEISIPFRTVGINSETAFGIALLLTDTVKFRSYWPESAEISDPSTWIDAFLE